MLINPKAILAAAPLVPTEATRYALNGIRVERKPMPGNPAEVNVFTCATNGKALILTRSAEPDAATLPAGGISHDRVEAFDGAMLEPKSAVNAAKSIGKRAVGAAACVGLEELSYNGHATLETWSNGSKATTTVPSVQGHFPPYEAVIPSVSPNTHAAVTLDAGLLGDICKAFKALGDEAMLTLFVSRDKASERPIVMTAHGAPIRATAVLMPITTDTPSEGEADADARYTEGAI